MESRVCPNVPNQKTPRPIQLLGDIKPIHVLRNSSRDRSITHSSDVNEISRVFQE